MPTLEVGIQSHESQHAPIWKSYDYLPFEMLSKQWQTIVLKLIANESGFYVYAPKQRGNVKKQLGYIGRYIRRPAIGVSRIEEYDGQYVTFCYYDKTEEQDKRETVAVEEFIARLIRHIPDEQFKTIRHYGVYSRRTKRLSKKLVSAWQKEARRWIVKAKRDIKRRTWREKLRSFFA